MAPPIVRTISRYLLRQHVAPLVFALAALTSLMLIQQVAKQLSGLLGKGLPPGVIAEVFVLSLPFIVAVTLPMAVLVAVLHVFTRLAGDNEMTALQAGGVSVARVVAPVLAGATGVALLSFLWNDQLLPRTNHQLRTLQVDIARKKPSLTLKEQVINEVVPGQTFLRASRIDGNTNKLKDVTLYDLSDAERRRIITADSGRMAYSAGGRDLFLTLMDGDIEEVNRTDPTQFNRTFYSTNRMRVSGVGNIFIQTEHDTYKSDREMSTCEMRVAAAAARRDASRAAGDARVAIENDLRRLAGLAPVLAPPAPSTVDTAPPGLYCRAVRQLATWLLPAEAEAQTPGGELPHGSAIETGGRGVDGGRRWWRQDGREAREPAQVVFDGRPRVVGGAPGVAARRRRGHAHLARRHLAVALVGVVLGLNEDVPHPRDPHAVGAVERAVELRRVGAVDFLDVSVHERQEQIPPAGGVRHPTAVRRDDAAALGIAQIVQRHVLELVGIAVDARGAQESLPRHDLVDHLLLERQRRLLARDVHLQRAELVIGAGEQLVVPQERQQGDAGRARQHRRDHPRHAHAPRLQRRHLVVVGQSGEHVQHRDQHRHRQRHGHDEREREHEHLGDHARRQPLPEQAGELLGDLLDEHQRRERRQREDERRDVLAEEISADGAHP